MSPTKTWQDTERWYAKDLGAERVRGDDKHDERDVKSKHLSVEVKHRVTAIPASVKSYIAQIAKYAKRGTIPFVIAHTPGTRREAAVVYIEYKHFKRLLERAGFIPEKETEANEVQ